MYNQILKIILNVLTIVFMIKAMLDTSNTAQQTNDLVWAIMMQVNLLGMSDE